MYERIAERIIENGLDQENLDYLVLRKSTAVEHIVDELHARSTFLVLVKIFVKSGSLGKRFKEIELNENGVEYITPTGQIQYIKALVSKLAIEVNEEDDEINEDDIPKLLAVIDKERNRILDRIEELFKYQEVGHQEFMAKRDEEIRRITEERQYNVLKGMLKFAILTLLVVVAGKTCSVEDSEAAVIDVNHEDVD
jgi:hypothetical protein